MAGMVPYAGEALDDVGHARQRPEIGAKPLRRRARPERPFHRGQGRDAELGLASRPARALQSGAAPGFPRVVPVVRTDARDAELLGHRRLRFPSREQPRGVQPARFQRDKISSGCGHASACDRTREIR